MGTDQGKLGNMHALGIISETAGNKMGELGIQHLTTLYSPYFWDNYWKKCWRIF